MITAEEAKKQTQENQISINEERVEDATEFVENSLQPLIQAKIARGEYKLEKQFSSSDLSGYHIPTIKKVVESFGYTCTYSSTKTINAEYLTLTIGWE